ncbi:AT-rich interactive domain-containing protein 4A [Sebastes umbrosus]|uniref:AT-rich interactive domain-containing protein 4A n=1 Tax=Sebastes umbrosus TaxID=72105 RepID=UPI00189CBA3C|nr:AT-rich interactive domain-containing protein 4A [Sebastes umbrosus]
MSPGPVRFGSRSTIFRAGLPQITADMKAADEPPYLTVGTDVSAKYRGAFCEAKIKTVKRMVKVKVNLKGESTSQVVQDDQVKGQLKVGSTVEVKTNEGLSSEAVISKLSDASLYTVVFDDGDEKTLRRTSLCLKGERHFAESETLDQLPLTNPEHFGTPVIGKKSNRGGRRSSQAVADEEKESSSSEDEEEDKRRLNDELLGKICSIESEEESSSWYLALVVSPSCNDEVVVKKDQCLVRAFSDSKFYTVARRHVHTFSSIGSTRSEFSSRRGFEAAQDFLRTGEVPDVWKMDMSQILDSSSSDDEDDEEEKGSDADEEDEEEKKKKKKYIKEEPEEELDPEERDHFLQQLYKFMEDRGTPINKPPVLGYKDLNLFKLFRLVYLQGGCHKIESGTVWKQIYMDLGIPVLNSAASYNVKTAYKKYLYGFEEYCRSASITFRTIHHNNPRPPTTPANQRQAGAELDKPSTPPPEEEQEEEPVDVKREEAESESESEKEEVKERHSSPRGRKRCDLSQLKAERESPSGPEKGGGGGGGDREEQREVRRRSNRRMDDSERGSEEDEEEDEEEEDEEEEEEGERSRGDGGEDEEDGDSVTGTKVRVKYGRGKTQKIYEAHIKKTDVDNGEHFYLVHYYGWNVRYDEWVKADRIIWPLEKGTKTRRRKKVKNKDEPETERDKDDERSPSMAAVKPPGAKRGRPQIRTTPTGSVGRSVSKTPSAEGRSNGKSSRTETPSNMANGDNTPRRRTRRTSGMYDSDRASNEDSGNSSEDSESEDPPDKKTSPWRGRTEAPPCQEEEEVKEEETNEVADVTKTAKDDNAVTVATADPLPVATATACPSMPQEKTDKFLIQSEKEEEEQGEEPAVEAAMLLVNLDKKTASVQETDNMSSAQEVLAKTSPSRTSPPAPGNRTSPPAPGNRTSPPAPGNRTSPPAPGNRTSPPAPGNRTSPPAPCNRTSPPAPGNNTSPPAPGNRTSPPAPCNKTSPPAPGNRTSPPAPVNRTSPPAPVNRTSPPAPVNRTSPPAPVNRTSPPAPGIKTSPPAPCNRTSPPAPGNRTSPPAPGNRTSPPAPGNRTSPPAPGNRTSPPAPGNKTAPPAPGNRTSLPAPGNKTAPPAPGNKTAPPPPGNKTSPPAPGHKTSPPAPGHKTSPEAQASSPQPAPAEEEDSRSTPLSSPRVKGRRTLLRETGSGAPPRIPLCISPAASPAHMASPPRSVLKRQDEPMVVLRCLPTQHLPPESPTADSDTDSATEEEEEQGLPEERSSITLKRKAAEQRAADKKLRPDRRQEEVASPKPSPAPSKMAAGASPKSLSSPLRRGESERRSEGVMKAEDWPRPVEEMQREVSEERLMGGAMKELEVHAGTPPPAPEAPGPSPAEELEPQIGPEALVCHEVDLDDPDEKEKPSIAPEHLLLMIRESQPAPALLPHLLHASFPSPHLPQPQLRPFLPAAALSSASSPGELHPARSAGEEEERGSARGEEEGDSSPASSSSTSLLSLQETKDRGQKRVMDCNLSPTAKKQKRNQKRLNTHGKVEKNGAGHSSDSEDQSRLSLSQKSQKSRCPGLSSPSSHSKDKHNFSPQRTYKWTFQLDELDSMSSTDRISFLQEKLQEIRKYYMTLKSEVASIDRRRKRLKKKEREVSNTTASTSSGSSDTGMSPSSASPTQNTVAVECR